MKLKKHIMRLCALLCSLAIAVCILPESELPAFTAYADSTVKGTYKGHTYQVFDRYETWSSAKKYCEKLGGHLVTIGSSGEQKFVAGLVKKGKKVDYLLGLEAASTGKWKWIDGTKYSYTNWASGNPDRQYGDYGAIYASTVSFQYWKTEAGRWACLPDKVTGDGDINASKIGFVCEWEYADGGSENTDDAPDASKSQTYSGHTYRVYNEPMTWTEAEAYCKDLGGHLVTIGSKKEQQFIESLIKFEAKPNYWIGLTRKSSNWHWVDDTKLSYTNYGESFSPKYGSEYYASIFSRTRTYDEWTCYEGEWDDMRNDASGSEAMYPDITLDDLGFICEWDKKISFDDEDSAQPTFTVMMYLDGADLEERLGKDTTILKDLIKGYNGNKNVRIVVQTGGSRKWHLNTVSAKRNQRWLIKNNKMTLIDDTLGQKNMGEADTLSSFIKYCRKKYPADRYALILSDHGGASTGVCVDENYDQDLLELTELKKALTDAKTHFDFIGMDACVMGNVESVLAVAAHSDYYVASENLSYSPGWNFKEFASRLCEDTSVRTTTLCKNICDGYIDMMNNKCITSISVIDTAKFRKDVLPALNKYAKVLEKKLTVKDFPEFANAKYNSEIPDAREYMLVDIQQMCALLGDEGKGEELHTAVNEAVVYTNKTTRGLTTRGLSVTLPSSEEDLFYVDEILSLYDDLGYNTKQYTSFMKHYVNIIAGALEYYYDVKADRVYKDCKWLNRSQFLSSSEYSKIMLSKRNQNIRLKKYYGEPFVDLSDSESRLVVDFGIQTMVSGTDGIKYYTLGDNNILWYNDIGYMLNPNSHWVTINGTPVPLYYDGKEMFTHGSYNAFYVPCRLENGTDAALIIYNITDDYGSSYWDLVGYQISNNNGRYLPYLYPVTSGMKVTLLYNAVNSSGNDTVKEKTVTLNSRNTVAYEDVSSSFRYSRYYSRLYFRDVFGIYHYTDIAEYDYDGRFIGMADF